MVSDFRLLGFTVILILCRLASLWTMYTVPRRAQARAKGDRVHQAKCDEGEKYDDVDH
jgi:hypothetical protein